MLTSLVSLEQDHEKKSKKLMKLVNIDEENLHLLNDLRNFNEFFRTNVIYDNIKSHKKKTGLHPLSRKYSYGKTTERQVELSPPLPSTFLALMLG